MDLQEQAKMTDFLSYIFLFWKMKILSEGQSVQGTVEILDIQAVLQMVVPESIMKCKFQETPPSVGKALD